MLYQSYGGMAERLNAAVLKTVEVNSLLGFKSLFLRQTESRLNDGSDAIFYFISNKSTILVINGVVGIYTPYIRQPTWCSL